MRRNGGTVKKTYNLPPDLIARVKRIFRARTETEAIIMALREMAFMDETERALRCTGGQSPHFRPLR